MTKPLFSIALFTKNRPQLVSAALASVLQQTCGDFEVIVCDNDDSDATQIVVSTFDDVRIRYCKTNGGLSMSANWDLSLSQVKGQYVLSLTDRALLKSYALKTLATAINRFNKDVYVWGYDVLDNRMNHVASKYAVPGDQSEVCSSADLWHLFFHTLSPQYFTRLPKGIISCYSADLLQEIREVTGGPACLPVSPDFNLAFMALALRPEIVAIQKPLMVWHSNDLSNGESVMYGGVTGLRFLSDLGLKESDLYKEMPIRANILHNVIINDFFCLKRLYPSLFQDLEWDITCYFLACRYDIERCFPKSHPLFAQHLLAWNAALDGQSEAIRLQVMTNVRHDFPKLLTRQQRAFRKLLRIKKAIAPMASYGRSVPPVVASDSIPVDNIPSASDLLLAMQQIEAQEA